MPLLGPEYACTEGQEVPPWAEGRDSVRMLRAQLPEYTALGHRAHLPLLF